jgi:hypothetical protein
VKEVWGIVSVSTLLGVCVFACAVLLFSYRSAAHFILAKRCARSPDIARSVSVGWRFSGVLEGLVAGAFISVMFLPVHLVNRLATWLAAVVFVGIVVDEFNAEWCRRRAVRGRGKGLPDDID